MAYDNGVTANAGGFFNNPSPTVTSGGPSVDQPFAAIGARLLAPSVYELTTYQSGPTGTFIVPLVGAGTTGATGTIVGNDVAGTVTLTTTTGAAAAACVTVGFGSPNGSSPQSVLLSPQGATAAGAGLYTSAVSATGFTVAASTAKASNTIKFSYLALD